MPWWSRGCHRVWVPPRSYLGDTGVSSGCHRAHVGATTCGCHQGHVWVTLGTHMGAIVVTWMPPRVGATQVTCGCQWCCVGATVSGCHQGHDWVPPRSHVGATKCGCHQGHVWGTLGSHPGAIVLVWVTPHVGGTKVTFGCHQGHMWVSVVSCGCHHVWVPPKSHWVPLRPCVCSVGVPWVPLGLCGHRRDHMGATRVPWVPLGEGGTMVVAQVPPDAGASKATWPMGAIGFVWVPLGSHRCHWVCVGAVGVTCH